MPMSSPSSSPDGALTRPTGAPSQVRPWEREDVILRSMTSPPPSGEAPIDFGVLVERAERALPPDFPTVPGKIMVAVDLDGTILTTEGVSSRVREAVARAQSIGVHVVVATGRSIGAAQVVFDEIGTSDMLAVCSNGALRMRWHGELTPVETPALFSPTELIEHLTAQIPDLIVGVETMSGYVLSAPFPQGELIERNRVVPFDELVATPAIKVIIRQPSMTRREFDSALTQLGVKDTWECSVGWTSWADILPLGVTKDSGLQVLADQLSVPQRGTVAIGDGTNDISMIRWANFGVVMGGASQEVRVHGDHVTGAVENDGAAAVLEAIVRHCSAH